MVEKRLLCPNRRRRTPAQFSWLDHRLMRERRLESCPVEAWALYLFLVTVGDAQGLSYYSDASLTARVPLDRHELRHARSRPHRRRSHRLRAPAVSGPLARRRAPPPPRNAAAPLHGASARCCNRSRERDDRLRHLPAHPASASRRAAHRRPDRPRDGARRAHGAPLARRSRGSAPVPPRRAPASSTPYKAYIRRLLEHHPYKRRRHVGGATIVLNPHCPARSGYVGGA